MRLLDFTNGEGLGDGAATVNVTPPPSIYLELPISMPGSPGPGVPIGGDVGDLLVKSGIGDYVSSWQKPATIPGPWGTKFLFASVEGVIEDDLSTDMTDQFKAACEKAIAQGAVFILDRKQIRFKQRLLLENRDEFSSLRIFSFIGTRLVLDGVAAESVTWAVISGTQVLGSTPVAFNSGAGYNPVDSFPFTEMAEDVERGWVCKPLSTAGMKAGHLIKIQSRRLPDSEHRFCMSVGELNRIRAVNDDGTIELDEKLRHKYRVGTLWTATVASSTENSVTFTSAPPAELAEESMQGLHFVTAAGEERYVQFWDADTNTATFPIDGRWDQLPFDTSPAPTSTILFDAHPYIFLIKPIHLTIQGITVDATEDLGSTVRGIQIFGVDGLLVQDCDMVNLQVSGYSIQACFEPSILYSRTDRSNWGSLGYTILLSECRSGRVDGYISHNSRRMSDTGAQCQCVGMRITNFRVTGGWKNHEGDIWENEDPLEEEEFNYGLGDHGQALDWVWDGGVVSGVKTGMILRGIGETVQNVVFEGPFQNVFLVGGGRNRRIRNIDVTNPQTPDEFSDVVHFVDYGAPCLFLVQVWKFARSGFAYKGPLYVQDITFQGIKKVFFFDAGGEEGLVVEDWFIDGVKGELLLGSGNVAFFDSGSATGLGIRVYLKNCTVTDCETLYHGVSSHYENLEVQLAVNSWMRVGYGKYRIRIADDAVLEIPLPTTKSNVTPGALARVLMYPTTAANNNWQAHLLMRAELSTGVINMGTVTNVLVSSDLGGSNPDGTINLCWENGGLTMQISNRLGGEIWGEMELAA